MESSSNNQIISDSRFEYKYQLTYPQYYCVRNAAHIYMKKDPYSLASPSGRYLVRSLYFDSYDLKNYQEKINGDYRRMKLRIRTYRKNPTENAKFRAEIKVRKGVMTDKYISWIDYAAYTEFMSNGHWPDPSNAVLVEFERYFHLKTMRPEIIIEYQREGYYARSKENLRITFDHQVHSAQASSLFPEAPFFRNHHHGVIIFEIKCDDQQPGWLEELVKTNGLCTIANSKYIQGIEVARSGLVRKAWSA